MKQRIRRNLEAGSIGASELVCGVSARSVAWMLTVVLMVGSSLDGSVLASVPASVQAAEPKHDFEVVNSSQVYFGSKKHPKSPAVCVADSVWLEIPEYKKILEEELDEDDPRYHLLLKRATKRFQRALKKLAGRDGYDVIGEVGSIKALGKKKKTIPTVTSDLIDLVTRA